MISINSWRITCCRKYLKDRQDALGGIDGALVQVVLEGNTTSGVVGRSPLGGIVINPFRLEALDFIHTPVISVVIPDNSYNICSLASCLVMI